MQTESRKLSWTAVLSGVGNALLVVVAAVGFAASWQSIADAAAPHFGPLAPVIPLLADSFGLGASIRYAVTVRRGHAVHGWRLAAHTAIGLTVGLNAMAADSPAGIPWHVAAPITLSIIVELATAEVRGGLRAAAVTLRQGTIAARLWLSAPIESTRTWLLMARTGASDPRTARRLVGQHAATREILRHAIPGRAGRRTRRIIARQVRAGSVTPGEVYDVCRRTSDPRRVLEAILRQSLAADVDTTPTAAPEPTLAPVPPLRRPVPHRSPEALWEACAKARDEGRLAPGDTAPRVREVLRCSNATARTLRDWLAAGGPQSAAEDTVAA